MSESLRIAYLTSAFARPSDTFVRSEVDRLRGLGVEVTTFSIRRPDPGDSADENVAVHQANTEYILEAGLARSLLATLACAVTSPIRFLKAKVLAWQTSGAGLRCRLLQAVYLMEAAYLARRIKRLGIMHIHNHIGENSATVAMLAGSLAQVPYSLTIHGPAIFSAPHRWALGAKLDRAAFTACISSYCKSQCMLYAQPSTWERLYVVRCAVGEAFLEAPQPERSDPPLVLFVGRLCVDKAPHLLVQAAAALNRENHRFRLILVGDGPERQAIEALVEREQLADVVELAGWKSSDEIRNLLRQATVFALPSFAEGLPIVIMEALAMECPVISTNIAAIGELVESGVNGWLIPPAELHSLIDALRESIGSSTEQLSALGRNGRDSVVEKHHPQRQAEQLRDLFRSVSID